ncbi:MAG: hypothetical protein QOJ29_4291 [Thermoleophilaceae bacterium]|jgi:hypothetical protein|nr:hypothetical protein [Thermoleophilaceae bacterium]
MIVSRATPIYGSFQGKMRQSALPGDSFELAIARNVAFV